MGELSVGGSRQVSRAEGRLCAPVRVASRTFAKGNLILSLEQQPEAKLAASDCFDPKSYAVWEGKQRVAWSKDGKTVTSGANVIKTASGSS